jgi:hypothetical protein
VAERSWTSTINVDGLPVQARAGSGRAVKRAVDLVAERTFADVPVDTRKTRDSMDTATDGTRGAVGFRSNKAPMLHENPRGHRYRNGKPKFLETNLVGSLAEIRAIAVEELRRALRGD